MEIPEFQVLEERISKVCELMTQLKKENKELAEKVKTLTKENEELRSLKEEVKGKVEGIIGRLDFLE
ncbi:hypothetical protein AMJ40_03075 [candidate division TA06 bacterium DG_26]|uniref:Cell division protein ZapB n=1 Tax=candidate division TA06 bacterium DG_26 TaxID=1703771 RepID=A0A0S7WJM3_UNCT6|nr:MAG: hypothetical protein AMJ40_03075 [candidate division TA06 bacterium DG_26]